MTHLSYIVASYAAFAGLALWLGAGAMMRLRRAQSRLRAADPRPGRATP